MMICLSHKPLQIYPALDTTSPCNKKGGCREIDSLKTGVT